MGDESTNKAISLACHVNDQAAKRLLDREANLHATLNGDQRNPRRDDEDWNLEDAEPLRMHVFEYGSGLRPSQRPLRQMIVSHTIPVRGAMFPARQARIDSDARWKANRAGSRKSNAKSQSMQFAEGSRGAGTQTVTFRVSVSKTRSPEYANLIPNDG